MYLFRKTVLLGQVQDQNKRTNEGRKKRTKRSFVLLQFDASFAKFKFSVGTNLMLIHLIFYIALHTSVTLTKKTVNKGKKIDISYLLIIINFKIVLRNKRRAVI